MRTGAGRSAAAAAATACFMVRSTCVSAVKLDPFLCFLLQAGGATGASLAHGARAVLQLRSPSLQHDNTWVTGMQPAAWASTF